MRQKIALISAYFPDGGHLVDMGCGSGQGTYDLARLFPQARVTGVDISPASISYAGERHRAANLDFMIGDIGHEIFPDETVDGIFNSSVLHHVTSFNHFDVAHVQRLLDRQAAQLKVGGLLAIRDFVVPAADGEVLLQLQSDDQPRGLPPGATRYQSCSTAELFYAFAAEFKSSVHPEGGVPWRDVSHLSPFKHDGFGLSALVDHRSAVEFLLRKDYRDDWAAEILEEYTYFSKAQFEAELSQRGFKILVSTNLYNPWIIKNRFEKRLRLCDPRSGAALAWPATNYLIVGQKVARDAPMRLCQAEAQETSKAAYLAVKTYRDKATEARFEVCRRPSEVVDIIPWYRDGDAVRVVVRSGYPRPILAAASAAPRVLEDITTSGYVVEPIAAVTDEVSDEAVRSLLRARVGMSASTIRSMHRGMTYFPSPGGIDEVVHAYYVEIDGAALPRLEAAAVPGFVSRGELESRCCLQMLRSYQVGGMFDARLNLNIYDLLLRLSRPLDSWIADTAPPTSGRELSSLPGLIDSPEPRAMRRLDELPTPEELSFLLLSRGVFHELSSRGEVLAAPAFEYAAPRSGATESVVCLPLLRHAGRIHLGLEQRVLPTPQRILGNAAIYCAPAWRLPPTLKDRNAAMAFVADKLESEHGITGETWVRLGGAYAPSPGLTPEIVSPYAVFVDMLTPAAAPLVWYELDKWIEQRARFFDGHLLIAALRAYHMLCSA